MVSPIEEIFENFISPENLKDLPSLAGLVLFTDSQDLPILLLSAANIRRTAKVKLAEQLEKTKKADLKSITSKIYFKECPCKFRLSIEYYKSVKEIFPSNYKDHITFVYPHFLKVNLNENIPFFSITSKPAFKNDEKILGPFPSQKSASVFFNAVQDAFKLCRRSDIVNDKQHSAACPYLQMDACCGVCAGKNSVEEYKNIITQAFEAGANPQIAIENFQTEMQIASKELNFEKAANLKRIIEKLSILKNQSYKWTSDLEKLTILHIDKSAKIKVACPEQGRREGSKTKKQTLAVFVMNFFTISDLGDFLADEKEKICVEVENSLAKLQQNQSGGDETIERFSIISYFLYRSNPFGLWMKAEEFKYFDF